MALFDVITQTFQGTKGLVIRWSPVQAPPRSLKTQSPGMSPPRGRGVFPWFPGLKREIAAGTLIKLSREVAQKKILPRAVVPFG